MSFAVRKPRWKETWARPKVNSRYYHMASSEESSDSNGPELASNVQKPRTKRRSPFNRDLYDKHKLGEPLFPNAKNSRFSALLILMCIAMRYHLPAVGVEDLLMAFNTIMGYKVIPPEKYHTYHFFSEDSDVVCHYYCSKCVSYIGIATECKDIKRCRNSLCNAPVSQKNRNNGSFFLTLPMDRQIQKILEEPGIFEKLIDMRNRNADDNVLRDIMDGEIYKKLVKSGMLVPGETYTLTAAVDGCPVFKSSKNSLVPIQFRLNELKPSERFRPHRTLTASLWFGKSEPNMCTFFTPFLKEAEKLANEGVTWIDDSGAERTSKILTICCICDTKAKPLVQQLKQFNGYYGCPYCLHPGDPVKYGNGKKTMVKFLPKEPGMIAERTDASFREDMAEAEELIDAGMADVCVRGVKGFSPFAVLLFFNLVWGFPIDAMHMALIGVMKCLCELWFDTSGMPYSVSKEKQRIIDEILLTMRPPSKSTRPLRPLSERAHLKANEWRFFLLRLSFVCLKGNLASDVYFEHFCLFASAMSLLWKDKVTKDEVRLADVNLQEFVRQFPTLYGETNMRFNVHLLSHLARNVAYWGPLWTTTAFSFESGNRWLLKLIKGTRQVLLQIANKFVIYNNVSTIISGRQMANNDVISFCEELMSFKSYKRAIRCGNAVIVSALAKVKVEDDEEQEALNMITDGSVVEVERCIKVLYNGFALTNDRKGKFCDSFVQFINGDYCKILYFFRNPNDKNSLLFFGRKLRLSGVDKYNWMKQCVVNPFDDVRVYKISEIKCKSILMKRDAIHYITDIPTTFEND